MRKDKDDIYIPKKMEFSEWKRHKMPFERMLYILSHKLSWLGVHCKYKS